MTLKFKAYKCVFPELFDYNLDLWFDENQYEIIYGLNQKDAIKKRCEKDENYSYWELKKNIRTKRFPEEDLFTVNEHPILLNLDNKQINYLLHSLGISKGDKAPKNNKFYRNYCFFYEKELNCEKLVQLGLMDNYQKLGSEIYYVTDIGIEVIKTLLLKTKDYRNENIY